MVLLEGNGHFKDFSLNDRFWGVHLGSSSLCQRIETREVTSQLRDSIENGCLGNCFGLTECGGID